MNRYLTCLLLALIFAGLSFGQGKGMLKDSFNYHIRKAYYFKNKAQYPRAIGSTNKAIEVAEKMANKDRMVDCINLLALIHIDLGKTKKAYRYLDINDQRLDLQEYNEGQIMCDALKSMLFIEEKQYVEALQLLRVSSNMLSSNNSELWGILSFYEGIVHYERQEYDKALVIFEKLLPIDGRLEPEYINTRILLYISLIYNAIGIQQEDKAIAKVAYEKSILNANNALTTAIKNDFPKLEMQAYDILNKVSGKTGDYNNAYNYLLNYNLTKTELDSLEQKWIQDGITENQEITFLSKSVDQLESLTEEQEKRVNMSKLTSVLSSALLIIISLLTISLYRNNQIKFKTNDLLLKKNFELEAAKEEAERAMKAKAQFLSTVSHELRTPLYAVTGLTHLLLEENPSESQKEHLKSLKFSGEYLLNFINDILQINKIEAKKLSLQKVPLDIRKVLRDVVDSLYQTAKENKNVIELEIDQNIPKKLIGDPLKLSQILINLIGNASKFTQKGIINVIAELVDNDENDVSIQFRVKDNGIGISKEMQATIFESFAQGSVQINRKYGGTGLGLTIVKSLLSLFDSEIKLESEIGKGSCFMFDIVFDKITGKDEIAPVETSIDVDDQFFENLHLLLVEDNKINQVITRKMLAKKGMTCDIANDGYEAIEYAKKPVYNAILMDIHMPGISGIKTTQEIRKFNKKVPIIALTAISLDESTEDFFEAGCNDLITKPFKPEVFYEKIGNNIMRNIEVDI